MSRLPAVLILAMLAAAPIQATARPEPARQEVEPMAWANLDVERDRPARLQITGKSSDAGFQSEVTAALERVSGHAPEFSDYAEGWGSWTTELPPPAQHGLLLHQALPLAPLLEVLARHGQASLTIVARYPRAGFVDLPGGRIFVCMRGTMTAMMPTTPSSRPPSLELGWRRSDVARAIGLLVLALLLPIAAGWLVAKRSMMHDQAPEAWFMRAQSLRLVTLVGWVGWLIATETAKAPELVAFALHGSPMVAVAVVVLAFMPVGIALTMMTRRVTMRLRGFDPLPRGGLMGSARGLVSLVLLLVAMTAFLQHDFRAGVFTVLGAIAAGVLLPGPRGPLGLTPQSLSSGALRDRLFDLARRAGVKLRDLYVVPMRRQRLANAFAVTGGVVMVADELLDRMSRREVDAVLAHEITHLEHQHPRKTVLAALLVWASITGVCSWLSIPYGSAASIAAGLLTWLFVARRFEFAADAGAAALTGDAEAMISGLGRLARLNQAPLAWGRGWAWLITHPTTLSRGLVIGRRAGIAPERVMELLKHGLPEDERYGHETRPGEARPGEERVFSTAWKGRTTGRLSLAVLAAVALAPAAALAMARALGVPLLHTVAIAVGGVLAFAVALTLHDVLAARIVSRLEPALRRRLGGEPGVASFVALSPGDRARLYEGFLDWDLGLLEIEADRLRYRGEQVTLDLPRSAVRAVELDPWAASWIRAPRVIVRWQSAVGEQSIALRAADATRVSAIGPASRALTMRLSAWRDQGITRMAEGSTGPAGLGPVTGRTPAESAGLRDLPMLVILLGLFSAAASFALGLDFWRGLDAFAAALLGMMIMRWPMMTSRERSPRKAGAPEPERRAA